MKDPLKNLRGESELREELERLRKENKALRKDAERYQWCRQYLRPQQVVDANSANDFDKIVDAARRGGDE